MKGLIRALIGFSLSGATTTTWELQSYQDFLRGRMSGLSITRDGRLVTGSEGGHGFRIRPGPDVERRASARRQRLPGHRKSRAFDSRGRGGPGLGRLEFGSAGDLRGGGGPRGRGLRRHVAGRQNLSHRERARHRILFPERALHLGAARPPTARCTRAPDSREKSIASRAGQGAVYYETGQSHVTALAFDPRGRLLAGSEPNGILYRIAGNPANGFVLYDANLPEIRAIVPMADGTIYAAGTGWQRGAATSAATSSTTAATPTSRRRPPASPSPTRKRPPDSTPRPAPPTMRPRPFRAGVDVEVTGVERSALYKILPDNTVETLLSSKDENIYDVLAQADGALLLVTDAEGRVIAWTRAQENRTQLAS